MDSLLELLGYITFCVLIVIVIAYIIDAIKEFHKIVKIFNEGRLMQRITRMEEDNRQHNEDISYLYTLIEANESEESES